MEKDFELIKHDGLFYEYLEMGQKINKLKININLNTIF